MTKASPNVFNYWVDSALRKWVSQETAEAFKDKAEFDENLFYKMMYFEDHMYLIDAGPKSPDSTKPTKSPSCE